MNTSVPVILFVVMAAKFLKIESYTTEDLKIVEELAVSMDIKTFTFVNENSGPEVIKKLINLSNRNLFASVINSNQLDDILSDETCQTTFFDRKTMIVTKENLNLTNLLRQVLIPNLLKWVVFVESFDKIQNAYVPVNMDVFVVYSTSGGIVVNKVYQIKPAEDMMVRNVGTWSRERSEISVNIPKNRKINFENTTLDVLIFLSEENCSAVGPKHVLDRMECFQQVMVNLISNKLNFRINVIECEERQHPYNFPNGTLSELFTALTARKADLSAASYIINNRRLVTYDFAWPTFTTKSMMYLKLEGSKSYWRAFLRPLSQTFWEVILAWIFLTGILIQVFHGFHTSMKFGLAFVFDTLKSVLNSLQVFCNQGLDDIPSWWSGRIAYIMMFFVVLIVYNAYSAYLISSLTVIIPNFPFLDLGGFLHDGSYKLMTLRSGFHQYYFRQFLGGPNSDFQRLMLKRETLPNDSEEGIIKLCQGENLVFVEYRENIVQHKLQCKISEIPRPALHQSVGLGFPKNSPYRELINRELTFLLSSGITQRMRGHLFSYIKLEQKEISNEEYEAVSVMQVASILFLLGSGLAFSCGVFIAEMIISVSVKRFYGWRRSQKRKRTRIYERLNFIRFYVET